MITGAKAVMDYFDSLNPSSGEQVNFHFAIYPKGLIEKGYPTYRTPADDSLNFLKSREMLQGWLGLQTYGQFTIAVNDKFKTGERGGFRQDFSLDNTQSAVAGIGSVKMPTADEIDKMVAEKVSGILDQKEREKQLKEAQAKVTELEKDLKEYKRKAEEPWTRLIDGLSPYAPHILGEFGIIPKSALVAGPGNVPVTRAGDSMVTDPVITVSDEQASEVQQRIQTALEKIAAARPPDWLSLLEQVADAIAAKPSLGDKINLLKMF